MAKRCTSCKLGRRGRRAPARRGLGGRPPRSARRSTCRAPELDEPGARAPPARRSARGGVVHLAHGRAPPRGGTRARDGRARAGGTTPAPRARRPKARSCGTAVRRRVRGRAPSRRRDAAAAVLLPARRRGARTSRRASCRPARRLVGPASAARRPTRRRTRGFGTRDGPAPAGARRRRTRAAPSGRGDPTAAPARVAPEPATLTLRRRRRPSPRSALGTQSRAPVGNAARGEPLDRATSRPARGPLPPWASPRARRERRIRRVGSGCRTSPPWAPRGHAAPAGGRLAFGARPRSSTGGRRAAASRRRPARDRDRYRRRATLGKLGGCRLSPASAGRPASRSSAVAALPSRTGRVRALGPRRREAAAVEMTPARN